MNDNRQRETKQAIALGAIMLGFAGSFNLPSWDYAALHSSLRRSNKPLQRKQVIAGIPSTNMYLTILGFDCSSTAIPTTTFSPC